jgi:Uma2 family endonuclease
MANIPDVDKTTYSLDDLLATDIRVEIINGEMIEMAAAGVLHQIIAGNIYYPLETINRQHQLGFVSMDGLTYLMYSNPGSLRYSFVPDVAFIRAENIPADFDITRPYPGIPDLAVEVVSPHDKAVEVQQKVQTYLDKGTEQVWVVYPEQNSPSVHQYIQGSSTIRVYQKPEEAIDTSGLFPGLDNLTLAVIFKLPAWAQK